MQLALPSRSGLQPVRPTDAASPLRTGSLHARQPDSRESAAARPEQQRPAIRHSVATHASAQQYLDAALASPTTLAIAAAVPLPILLALALQNKRASRCSPAQALKVLTDDSQAVLIDIRSKQERSEEGSPDLRSIKGRTVVVPYEKVAKAQSKAPSQSKAPVPFNETFGKRISTDATLVLLDSLGKDSPAAAKLAQKVAQKVYWVAGGAEGPQGWKTSGLPWREPSAGLDLLGLWQTARDTVTGQGAPVAVAGAGVAAAGVATVAGALEFEQIAEVVGAAAVAQLAFKRLFFQSDRVKTIDAIKGFLEDIGGDVGGDLNRLTGKLFDEEELEDEEESRASPLDVLTPGGPTNGSAASKNGTGQTTKGEKVRTPVGV